MDDAADCTICLYFDLCRRNIPCKHFAYADEDAYLDGIIEEKREEYWSEWSRYAYEFDGRG